MSGTTAAVETYWATQIAAAALPELAAFAVEPFAAQIDLANDQVTISSPQLLVAVVGAAGLAAAKGGDALRLAFVAVVPGLDQATRRQDALDALFALRDWMQPTALLFQEIRTEALHPVAIVTLYAQQVG